MPKSSAGPRSRWRRGRIPRPRRRGAPWSAPRCGCGRSGAAGGGALLAAIVVALVVFAAGALTVALLRSGGRGARAGSASGRPSSSANLGPGAGGDGRQAAGRDVGRGAGQPQRRRVVRPGHVRRPAGEGVPRRGPDDARPGDSDPLGSAVIVATAAVRSLFGSRLTTVYAPTVIASFGSGSARIDVRAYAAGGAAGVPGGAEGRRAVPGRTSGSSCSATPGSA